MHLTKLSEARPERGEGWGTQPSTELEWLIDAALGGSEQGAVGRMRIAAGGGQAPHRHPSAEEVTFVLDGSGTALLGASELPLERGNVLYAPAGAVHAVRSDGEELDLLVVLTAPSATAAGWEEAAAAGDSEARVLSGAESEETELDDPATGFYGIGSQWLVDGAICGSESIIFGRSRFAATTGKHALHRHPSGSEFVVLIAGAGIHFGDDGEEVAVAPGDAALVPIGAWHGFRNTTDSEARALFGYFGAASFDDAGYELKEDSDVN